MLSQNSGLPYEKPPLAAYAALYPIGQVYFSQVFFRVFAASRLDVMDGILEEGLQSTGDETVRLVNCSDSSKLVRHVERKIRSNADVCPRTATLAELERGELDRLLEVADSDFAVLPRMMLDLKLIRGGKTVYTARALNEAVVRALVSVVRLEALGDGREITEFSGDGIIVSTPTGSTAYSMAAGGPIVEPEAECIILTPICTFRLAARSFVLTDDREVRIRTIDQGEKEVMLSIDGEPVEFLDGDELIVKRSEQTLLMARVSDRSFYDIVFEKLNDKDKT